MPDTTPVQQWKKDAGTLGEPVELPSGKTAIIKAAGMEAFLKSGMIPNSLMSVISNSLKKAQRGEEVSGEDFNMEEMMDDPAKINDILQLVDNVAIASFQEPTVHDVPPHPEPDDDPTLPRFSRRPDILYVDEVGMDDKFFVFSVAVGGTKDLERFREGLGAGVGSVPARTADVKPAKSTGRTTARKS
jgi:hypothetical protein